MSKLNANVGLNEMASKKEFKRGISASTPSSNYYLFYLFFLFK
jgi:hypothetical protein